MEGHARRGDDCLKTPRRAATCAVPGESRGAEKSLGGCSKPVSSPAPSPLSYAFTLTGQVSGGKNNVGVTRTGKRFPNKSFVRWRTSAIAQVWIYLGGQMGMPPYLFAKPRRVTMTVRYHPGDLIRRDAPALIDALCHLLERTGLVEDDAQIKTVNWQEMELDRDRPRVELTLTVR